MPFGNAAVEQLKEKRKEPQVEGYSRDDLVSDQYFPVIEEYMQTRFGVDDLRGKDKPEVVEMYLNQMRAANTGNNLPKTTLELAWVNTASDEERGVAGKAYELYNGMDGIFSSGTNLDEKASALFDHVRYSVLDPTNLFSFGVGKLAAKVGGKTGLRMAQRAAAREAAKHTSKEAAQKSGLKVFTEVFAQQGVKEVAEAEARVAAANSLTTSSAIKEVLSATTFDAMLGVAADAAAQGQMIRTDLQEGYSIFQGGLAAAGGLAMGGLQALHIKARGVSGVEAPDLILPDPPKPDPSKATASFTDTLRNVASSTTWKDKIANGVELEDLDTKFWLELMYGNDEMGFPGLTTILLENGFKFSKRTDDDNITNWAADIIRKADPVAMKSFMEEWERVTGINLTQGKSLVDTDGALTPEGMDAMDLFVGTFAKKVSDAGSVLGMMGNAAQALGKGMKDLNMIDLSETLLLTNPVALGSKNAVSKLSDKVASFNIAKHISNMQNNIIRLIVTHPSTSKLNVVGWAASAATNTVSDLGQALIHGGESLVRYALRDETGANIAAKKASTYLGMQKQRLLNTIDSDMTYEAFNSYVRLRGGRIEELTSVLPGGVEDLSKAVAKMGFDPTKTVSEVNIDTAIDFIQTINMVKAQDVFTKSQEFVYQMDKQIRLAFDKNWTDFFSSPDAHTLMQTEAFKNAEGKATYETLRAIYSKSYKSDQGIGELAAAIEDFRNLPGVGLLIPFGRFFNNTVAFMSDSTGLSAGLKLVGGNQERDFGDLAIRAGVAWGAVLALQGKEEEYIGNGLAWHEAIDSTGQVTSHMYDWPISGVKFLARVRALNSTYSEVGEISIPPDMMKEGVDLFLMGNVTRQIGTSEEGIFNLLEDLLSGRESAAVQTFMSMTTKIPSTAVSGATRWVEPWNQAVGLARGENYSPVDRRQGIPPLNNALRYMDQIVGAMVGDISPEKFSASRGSVPADPSKAIGGQRVATTHTYTQKMMNMAGVQDFKVNSYSDTPEADNKYNQLFFSYVEKLAQALVLSENFREAPIAKKVSLKNDVVKMAANMTYQSLKYSTDDPTFSAILELQQKNGGTAIDLALEVMNEELGASLSLEDLTFEQVNTLQAVIDWQKYNNK